MRTRVEGRCNCGALSVAAEGEPSLLAICHCTNCRRFTGNTSAYIIAFPIDNGQVTGHPAQWTTRSESGGHPTRFFCTRCGSSMYAHNDGGVGVGHIYINGGHCAPGTLPPPILEYWMRSAETWDSAHAGTLVTERQDGPRLLAPGRPPRTSQRIGPSAGGCNCGKIQVRLRAMGRAVICHCTTCRRFTGSISAYLVTVARDDLEIVGCPKLWGSVADSGNAVTRMFCGECGSSICNMQDRKPTVEVFGGILPPRSLPPPAGERFRHTAEAWAKVYPLPTVDAVTNGA